MDKLDQALALMDSLVRRDVPVEVIATHRTMQEAKKHAEQLRSQGDKNIGWSGQGKSWQVYRVGSGVRKDATPSGGPVITLELAPGFDNLSGFLEFWKYVKNAASGGHSFMLAADESADGPGRKEFGKQLAGATCFFDGDGSDHIARILVDGEEFK
jgi:hypothetical protein